MTVFALSGCATVAGVEFDRATHVESDPPAMAPIQEEQATTPSVGPCADGFKFCSDTCVAASDPAYGCHPESCSPCSLSRAAGVVCQANACAVTSCDAGYADCNRNPSDGCESDLTLKATCGSCGVACPGGSVCNRLLCAEKCADGLADCSGSCVDTKASDANCGACGNSCAAPTGGNGVGKCRAGSCAVQCNAGFHLCGGKCVADNDVKACGATCAVCPDPETGRAACNAGVCGATCPAGFEECATGCCAKITVPIATVSAGGNTTCAVSRVGDIYCWGAGELGQLGIGPLGAAGTFRNTPQKVAGAPSASGVTVGGRHACAWNAAGDLYCWGSGSEAQLGLGAGISSDVPQKVPALPAVVGATAGGNHTCAWTAGGALYCWGEGAKGALGTGGLAAEVAPRLVDSITETKGASAGAAHTCAWTNGGAVACWGTTDSGRLGIGPTAEAIVSLPQLLVAPTSVAGVDTGFAHTCAWKVGGDLACWGAGGLGRLGIAGLGQSDSPAAVLLSVAGVALGQAHTCGWTNAGEAYCWGRAVEGQLGIGPMRGEQGKDTPQRIPSLNAKGITTGGRHSCAWTALGEVYCWGSTDVGQLGLGAAVPAMRDIVPIPRRVSSL